jgi:malate dehydrogenase (oxaloacetate-decarboxylating)
MADSKGILHPGRKDLEEKKEENPLKWEMCIHSNGESRAGDQKEAMRNADVCIAASKPGPGTIKKEWVSRMADDAIVFPCANPIPEIWPWEAKEAGARIVATGRSDFPNQINNSLGFPGIFRGVLDVMAKTITDEMAIAASQAIAETAEERGLNEEYIVPSMDEWEVFPNEAVAVGMKAIEQGIARKKIAREEIREEAESIIKLAREETKFLMKGGFIRKPPSLK